IAARPPCAGRPRGPGRRRLPRRGFRRRPFLRSAGVPPRRLPEPGRRARPPPPPARPAPLPRPPPPAPLRPSPAPPLTGRRRVAPVVARHLHRRWDDGAAISGTGGVSRHEGKRGFYSGGAPVLALRVGRRRPGPAADGGGLPVRGPVPAPARPLDVVAGRR